MSSEPAEASVADSSPREGHGWWPYLVPYAAFVLMTSFLPRMLPDGLETWGMLVVRPAIVLGLVLWFRARGGYPEWRGEGARIGLVGGLLDVAVGLGLTVVWVAPYVWFPALRPEPGGEFDPAQAGAALVPVILALRLFGYAIVTPIFEELFIRSFVMRVADAWEVADFRDIPLARCSARSLAVTTVVFTMGHVPWEYWVCVPWVVLSSLWFYHRKSLSSIMLVHGVTNAALLALAVWGDGLVRDATGEPMSFWFFV